MGDGTKKVAIERKEKENGRKLLHFGYIMTGRT